MSNSVICELKEQCSDTPEEMLGTLMTLVRAKRIIKGLTVKIEHKGVFKC